MKELTKDRILKLRKMLKLSRKDFGWLIEVNYKSVYYYEKGDRLPSIKTCRLIAKLAAAKGIKDIDVEWIRPDD